MIRKSSKSSNEGVQTVKSEVKIQLPVDEEKNSQSYYGNYHASLIEPQNTSGQQFQSPANVDLKRQTINLNLIKNQHKSIVQGASEAQHGADSAEPGLLGASTPQQIVTEQASTVKLHEDALK